MQVKTLSDDVTVKVCDMKDGDLGVLVDESKARHGTVVQMVRAAYGVTRDTLLKVGGTIGESWSGPLPDFRVRILKKGEKIEVVG